MARPLKDGVDYFPKDTDFYEDDKVRLLRAEFGAKGMYALDYLLCDLYGKNGYFTKWDKNKCFLVSDGAGCGCSPEFMEQLIQGCIRCSFFDERVLKAFGVLTSAGIQRRYIRMFKSRDEIQIFEEYFLLDLDNKKDVPASILDKITLFSLKSINNPDKRPQNPVKSSDNSQSKVKESKVEYSRVNNTTCSERKSAPSCSADKPVIELILNDKSLHLVYRHEITNWSNLYPNVDVMQELRNMKGWLESNPKKRKTKHGINRFINAWLTKKQDRSGPNGNITGVTATGGGEFVPSTGFRNSG